MCNKIYINKTYFSDAMVGGRSNSTTGRTAQQGVITNLLQEMDGIFASQGKPRIKFSYLHNLKMKFYDRYHSRGCNESTGQD